MFTHFFVTLIVIVGSSPVDYNSTFNIAHFGLHAFGKPDAKSGFNLNNWNVDSGVNPEEVGEYVEGDILFPVELSKNGIINESKRWNNAVIPYEINGRFTNKERELIGKAMEQYHKHTCIRFRPRNSSDVDWISITRDNTGCWSSVGRVGGKQVVNLQSPGCLSKIGTAIHEFLHVCGFLHEQNRWERDTYVKIHWSNINETKKSNFRLVDNMTATAFGIEYDYGSVMHYSAKAFSINDQPTITVLNSSAKIGQREGFSDKDIAKLRRMYNCGDANENVIEGLIDVSQHVNGLGELISILFPQV